MCSKMYDLFCYPVLLSFAVCVTFLIIQHWNLIKSVLAKSSVDPNRKAHGGELVAKVLKDHGVANIFTLIGGHISPIIVAAQNAGIRVIDTRHEVTAVFAADAIARLSGNIGVAAVTAGPGVTNTVTAVKNAQMAESPILLLGGAAATLLKGRGSLQDIDQLSLFKSLCKYSVSVSCVRQIIPSIRKAIQIAMSGTPGPVFVELPLDVLYPYHIVRKEVPIKENPRGFFPRIMNLYLQWYLHNLFANAFEHQETKPLPIKVPLASDYQVENCKSMIETAKRPVLIVGNQAVIPASKARDVQEALNILGIPCFLSGMARGLLGKQNSLQMRQNRKEALQEADLIILAGAVCDFRLSYGKAFNKQAKIVAVNLNKEQLFKNSDAFWKPTLAVNASASDFLIRLASACAPNSCNQVWLKTLSSRDTAKDEKNCAFAKQPTAKYLNPLSVLFDLEQVMNDNTILVADGGDFVATASYILRPRGPLKWLDPGPFGTLGVGAGFALGAKLWNPESDVIIIYGDGSVGFSIVEFDTFVRHKLPVVAVVGNDACWSQIEREQVPMFGSNSACQLAFSDYHAIPQAFGGIGFQIGADNSNDVSDVLKSAILASKEGKSVLVNALIGKTEFRSGSISI